MRPVRIILVGLICGVVSTVHADIASVQYVQSIVAQADWDQSDSTATDYIQNKPTIPSSAADIGAVPTSRTINTHALSSDVTLNGADIAITGYTKPASTSAVAANDTVNAAIGKLETALDGKQDKLVAAAGATQNITGAGSVTVTQDANGKITISGAGTDVSGKQDQLGGSGDDGKAIIASGTAGTVTYRAIDTTSGGTSASTDLITSGAVNAGLAGKVSTSTTVNGNALSSNVTLDGADIALTGYTKPASTSAVAATDTINQAIGKLEAGLLTVGTTSGTVAAGDDARFDSVPTTQPTGTPPTGRVWVWFN